MAATTPTLGLYKPGGGSSGLIAPDETVDIDKLNANADLLDAEALSVRTRIAPLEDQDRQYRGPAASLAGLSGMRLGDTYQETDAGKRLWYYDGTNWITNEAGLYLIRPTSVAGTGATLDNAGHTALAASQGNIDLLGIFSARFDRYLVDIEIDAAAGDNSALFRLMAGGVEIATASYSGTFTEQAVGIGPTKNDLVGLTSFGAGRYATNGGVISLEFFRPSKTTGSKQFLIRSQDGAGYHRIGGGYLVTAAAIDGLRLMLGGVIVTAGKIKVYGYR